MAFTTDNSKNNNASDKQKSDAFINLRSVCNREGQEFSLTGIRHFGIGLLEENGGLSEALIEAARENGGQLSITLKATVNVVPEKLHASEYGEF